MAFSESVLVAIFCISVVFAVLIALFAIIRIFSVVISILSKNKLASQDSGVSIIETEEFSSGVLNLKDVDEQTAAIIMAIVSDKSGISLSDLCFKSIRLIKE